MTPVLHRKNSFGKGKIKDKNYNEPSAYEKAIKIFTIINFATKKRNFV